MTHWQIVPLSALLVFLSSFNNFAEEIDYPVAAYSTAELQKVRTWEKSWTGKIITSADVDQIKDRINPKSVILCLTVRKNGGFY